MARVGVSCQRTPAQQEKAPQNPPGSWRDHSRSSSYDRYAVLDAANPDEPAIAANWLNRLRCHASAAGCQTISPRPSSTFALLTTWTIPATSP